MDEVVAVPRSEGVEDGGLVEEAELGEVLHLLQGRRVRLLNVILVDLEKILVIVGVFRQCLTISLRMCNLGLLFDIIILRFRPS